MAEGAHLPAGAPGSGPAPGPDPRPEDGAGRHPPEAAASAAAAAAAALTEADPAAFLRAWAEALSGDLPCADLIVAFAEEEGGGGLAPVLVWPDPEAPASLVEPVARRVLATRAGAEARDGEGRVMLAVPVEVGGRIAGLVALRLRAGSPAPGPAERARLVWATGWLEARLWQVRALREATAHDDALAALDLVALVGAQRRLLPAAQALVSELGRMPGVARAALGLVKGMARPGAAIRLEAISGAAWFRRRGEGMVALSHAMEEALDQMGAVCLPPLEGAPRRVTAAHAEAMAGLGARAIVSAPLFDEGRAAGVLTLALESEEALTPALVARLEVAADLLGPVLELKRRQQGWLAGRAVDAAERGLRALGARNRPSYRLASVAVLVALALPFVIHAPLRIVADATLEGSIQRVAVAPFEGRIAAAPVRAGDRVAAGDLLFSLDDRDLVLEATKWRSELAQLEQASRAALAAADRAEVRQLAARRDQAAAQLALAEAQLQRAQVRAPISGIVIAGDLSQRLGAPVEQGAELFTIAPLDDFRLILDLDERDLELVAEDSRGSLRLKARPGLDLPFAVASLTSVARTEEGRRLFRAEARLLSVAPDLRPGLEGVARIEAGRHSLAHNWTRRLRDWVQLALWRWLP